MTKREVIRRARGIVHVEDPLPFQVLAWKSSLIEEELKDERHQEGVRAWPPVFVKRRPFLIIPLVVIPWIIVLALAATDTSVGLPMISTVILAAYWLRLIDTTLERCSR